MAGNYRYIRFFDEIGIDDIPSVGGKNASLGEMVRALMPQGVRVPNGFAITAQAYWYVLEQAGIAQRLREALDGLRADDVEDLARRGKLARDLVYGAPLPEDLQREILQAYRALQEQYGPRLSVAVRSSATAEDLPDVSFAGAHETFLNVQGEQPLLDACRRCFASLFTDRAIHYRIDEGFDHFKVALSIGVMKMVRSDLAASGVIFSLDTESGFRDVVFITGAYGLGENVVQGAVDPDEFYVFKPTFEAGRRAVLRRALGSKKIKMVYAEGGSRLATRNVPTSGAERERFCLSDKEVLTLADYAIKVERHYSAKAGKPRPMDMEWAKDGDDGLLYMVQARPETVASQKRGNVLEIYSIKGAGEVLTSGRSVGEKVVSGTVRVIPSVAQLAAFRPGEVLVADTTTPDWEPVMKTAGAVVTNRGGRTCHAAIIARELGIPAIVGCGNATEAIANKAPVTVSCAEGDAGHVYAGRLKFRVEKIALDTEHRPRTKIMMNVGNPDQAFEHSFVPSDGVGLARLEFIINHSIQVHPRALLEYESLDKDEQKYIDRLTAGYADRKTYFINRLAEGIGTIAASFYPKPVIVRLSDFKSNEYASLFGGARFEPNEENPMLGLRGASRYYAESFQESFALECAALRQVREQMGLVNVAVMIPFVRSVDEAERVLGTMRSHGLERGKAELKIYIMCEIPANALLAEEFLQHLDGFSIGSNDLTQLTLGVDRDSGLITGFDERNPAVLKLMEMAIHAARKLDKYVGICGQAPSDYPEITTWLVRHGIASISLNPDSVIPMTRVVLDAEQTVK